MFLVIPIKSTTPVSKLTSFLCSESIEFTATCNLNSLLEQFENQGSQTYSTFSAFPSPPTDKKAKIEVSEPENTTEYCIEPEFQKQEDEEFVDVETIDEDVSVVENEIKKPKEEEYCSPSEIEDQISSGVDVNERMMQILAVYLQNCSKSPQSQLNVVAPASESPLQIPESFSILKSAYQTKRGPCQICQQDLSITASNRRKHVFHHLGLKRWKCSDCGYRSGTTANVKNHYSREHPGVEEKPFGDSLSPEEKIQFDSMMDQCFPLRGKIARCF